MGDAWEFLVSLDSALADAASILKEKYLKTEDEIDEEYFVVGFPIPDQEPGDF